MVPRNKHLTYMFVADIRPKVLHDEAMHVKLAKNKQENYFAVLVTFL